MGSSMQCCVRRKLLATICLFGASTFPLAMTFDTSSATMKQGLRASNDVRFFPLPLSADDTDGIFFQYECKHPESADAAAAFAASLRASKPKMIVFDKDGTLGDCTASFRRWVHHMALRVRELLVDLPTGQETKQFVMEEFYQQIGWDVGRNDAFPSSTMAAGTWEDILGLVHHFLLKHSSKCKESVSLELVEKWHLELGDLHGQDKPLIENLKGMMMTCQKLGYLVGVCTSDDRVATDNALQLWGVDSVVDVSICGDEVAHGKPSAVPLQALCQRANKYLQEKQGEQAPQLLLQDCIMVGDTSADTGTATSAKVGFCVGVLTGSGTSDQLLDTGAHLILPHVGHIPALLETLEQLASNRQESQ